MYKCFYILAGYGSHKKPITATYYVLVNTKLSSKIVKSKVKKKFESTFNWLDVYDIKEIDDWLDVKYTVVWDIDKE